jgi:molybdenum cofactor cytidylyltransferase
MMPREPAIGGLILAAGAGRRFGGSKLTAELAGRPLLEHAVTAMLRVPAVAPIVVVLGADAERVTGAVDLATVETVVAADWAEGMSASLRAGIEAHADADAVLVTLGDQPFITPQAIAAVCDRIDSGALAARATYGGEPGHPVLLRRELFDRLQAQRGDRGARDVLGEVGAPEVECGHLCSPRDIDTRADLEVARRAAGSG